MEEYPHYIAFTIECSTLNFPSIEKEFKIKMSKATVNNLIKVHDLFNHKYLENVVKRDEIIGIV